ncbi:MAG: PAS domain-containing protein [Sphingomonadaceae bacterium]
MHDDKTIVSSTDLQGNINYANPYFIEVSGFTEEELIGAPQNILRHPDMPVEAFADLWATIRGGMPWAGVVKNRCKNGDFYWVLANVTPVIEQGKQTGYLSVRTKPSREQIRAADELYRSFKAGNPGRLRIQQGRSVSTGIGASLKTLLKTSLRRQLAIAAALLCGGPLLLAAGLLSMDEASIAANTGWLSAALLAFGLGAGALCRSLYGNVVVPLQAATNMARCMAGGDLTAAIDIRHDNEVGQLQAALRQSNINLHSIIGDVHANFEDIRVSTAEIATGNMESKRDTRF